MATYIPGVTDVFPQPSLFTPDFSIIDTLLQRRQKMYEQGFAQVNSKYNYINRDVTNPYNREVRDRFLKEAKENLKNLSAMDLSQQENVDSATRVFDPFVNNTNVLGDQLVTAHLDEQESIADSYRLKDGGKEFSEDNLRYVRMQREAFANDDPNSWKSYYQNKRYYNPYYDYHKEYSEAMKNFKPSSYEIDRVNGLYKITEKNASAKQADIKRYLDAVLSDKAKKQIAIEGAVRYGSDLNNLAQEYSTRALKELDVNNEAINQAKSKLSLIKDPKEKLQYESYINSLTDENEEIFRNVENIKKGDLSIIKANSDKLASSMYYSDLINKVSNGFSYENISKKISGDAVNLALMKESRADIRQQRGFNHAKDMLTTTYYYKSLFEKYKKDLENKTGGASTVEKEQLGEEAKTDFKNDLATSQKNIEMYRVAQDNIRMQNKQHILDIARKNNPNLTIKDIDQNFISKWLESGGPNGTKIPVNDIYYKNLDKIAEYESLISSYDNRINQLENAGYQGLSEEERRRFDLQKQKINEIGTITLSDGSTISSEELANGIQNNTIKYTPAKTNFTDIFSKRYAEIKIANKTYFVDPSNGANVNLLRAFQTIKSYQNDPAYVKFKENIEEKLKNSNFTNVGYRVRPAADTKEDKALNNIMSGIFPQYNVQQVGVGMSSSNQGTVFYKFTTKGRDANSELDESSIKNVANELIAKGYDVKTKKIGDTYELAVGGINNPYVNSFKLFTNIEKAVLEEVMSAPSGVQMYTSVPFKTQNSNSTQFTISKGHGGYYLNIVGLNEPYLNKMYSSPTDAIMDAKMLTADNNALLNSYYRSIGLK